MNNKEYIQFLKGFMDELDNCGDFSSLEKIAFAKAIIKTTKALGADTFLRRGQRVINKASKIKHDKSYTLGRKGKDLPHAWRTDAQANIGYTKGVTKDRKIRGTIQKGLSKRIHHGGMY